MSLKGDRAFQRLRRGKAGHSKLLTLRWHSVRTPGIRVGIVVNKKVGKAVTRNRVRRRIKEALREMIRTRPASQDAALHLIIIARPEAAGASYQQLKGALEHATYKSQLLKAAPAAKAPPP